MVSKVIALDIETTGLNPRQDRIHGVGIHYEDGKSYYFEPRNCIIQEILGDSSNHIVGHNIRFDLKFLISAGYKVDCQVWDTKVLAQLIDENQQLGLKALTEKYFDVGSLESKSELDREVSKRGVKHVGDLCRLALDGDERELDRLIAKYCLEDCRNTLALWKLLIADLKRIDSTMKDFGFKKSPLDYYVEEALPTEKVLMGMELRGIQIDVNSLKEFREALSISSHGQLNQMTELALHQIKGVEDGLFIQAVARRKSKEGKAKVKRSSTRYKTKFNWQSADHISALIFNEFQVSRNAVEKTASGKPSTSEYSLSTLCESLTEDAPLRKFLKIYAAWKKTLKLLNTYTGDKKGLLSQVEEGRVYADYLQAGRGREGTKGGTVTGRLSSRSPNMQNLPRNSEIKSFFTPDKEHIFIYFDYSQLELRLAAHLSGDPLMIDAYKTGKDLHQMTADRIGESRQVGKTVNFLMIYDGSSYRLSGELNKSPEQCQNIINGFFETYNEYARYLDRQKRFMSKHGLTVSILGRVRRLKNVTHTHPRSKEWRHAVKQGYNFPIQSLGASITKRAMIKLASLGYKIVTQVHDSVVIQVPDDRLVGGHVNTIRRIAEGIETLSVPLKVDIKVLTSLLESDIVERGRN